MLSMPPEKKSKMHLLIWIVPAFAIVMILAIIQLLRPLPAPTYEFSNESSQAKPILYSWPEGSIEAVHSDDGLNLDSPLATKVVPTASIAKLITVLTVLNHKPLQVGQDGPSIAITQDDMTRTDYYHQQGGTFAIVSVGQQWTERQMINAMIVGSSNNMADALAVWAFGSLDAYKSAATSYLAANGIKNTTVGVDASGLSPTTTSTALDLISIAKLADAAEPIKTAAALPTVTVPGNVFFSTNHALGVNGVDGLKTGTSDQAGDCFVFSSTLSSDGVTHRFYGAVLGASDTNARFSEAEAMLRAVYGHYSNHVVVAAGSKVGVAKSTWGTSADLIATSDIQTFTWDGNGQQVTLTSNPDVTNTSKDTIMGLASVGNNTTTIQYAHDLPDPSLWWRLSRLN